MRAIVVVIALALAAPARADGPAPAPTPPAPDPAPEKVLGIRVRGKTKVTRGTAMILAHLHVGDLVTPDLVTKVEAALLSSELFKTVDVSLQDTTDGVVVIATVEDKMSWIAAPTLFVTPSSWAFGGGFAENDLFGQNRKLLLYAQGGNRKSLFFGTYLDPSVNGSRLQLRFDLYALHEVNDEYANPPQHPGSFAIDRESTEIFLDAGALAGWRFFWWLVGDLRLRGAHVSYANAHADDPEQTPLPRPEVAGWDVSLQARLTLDRREHLFGVTWGPYLQLHLESSLPGLGSYGYQLALARAYYSWVLFGGQELELRGIFNIGRHLPFNEELTNGGVSDLRGYDVAQFRGDLRTVVRAEYSVPIAKWNVFAFRALAFWDNGFIGNYFHDPSGKRNYLPSQAEGTSWLRNDMGIGVRVYVSSIVLPLLGLDVGYGIEAHSPEIYFELGLTDF